MASEEEIEVRRRKVQELSQKGYTQHEIATKLEVHSQTICADIKFINDRYKKLVSENPEYLSQQLEKILKFIDDFDLLMKEYWELKEQATNEITVTDKKGNTKTIPYGDLDDQRKVLDSIRQVIVEKAKILKLVSGDNKYLTQNYVHADSLVVYIQPIMNIVKQLVVQFVPEEKKQAAFTFLSTGIKKQKELSEGNEK